MNTNTLSICLPPPSNLPSIDTPPPVSFVDKLSGTDKSTRMNFFRTRKLFGIDQLTRIHHPYVCRMSTTPPARYLPPPDPLSGNHPEPVKQPVKLCFFCNVKPPPTLVHP